MKKIGKLCLVDDDSLFQFLTQRVIEETDLVEKVEVFSNGLQAINFLKFATENPEELPNVILLDINMPVLDGWGFLDEYAKLLPKMEKKIAMYIVSSSNDPNDVKRSKTIDTVKDFVIKPITKEKFIEMIRSI